MRRVCLLLSLLVLLGGLMAPVPALAAGAADVCTGGAASESAFCKDQTTENPLTGPNGVLLKVVQLIAVLAGIAAIIVIVVSGLQFVLSSGDPAKTQAAKSTLVYALVGLVVIALSGTIVSFVLSRL